MPQISIRAIIVDDEWNAIQNLRTLLNTYCPSLEIVDIAQSGEVAIPLINDTKPDVVFLDISMPGKNGFDILNRLEFTPLIVFVTAYEKYALKALKASAVDFLLKPVDVAELVNVEHKLQDICRLLNNDFREHYRSVLGNLINILNTEGTITRITLKDREGYSILELKDILYLEGDNNYTTFNIVQNRKIVVSKTLKEYETILNDRGFIRVHKSSIINLAHLKSISRDTGNIHVVMSDEKIINVSRRRAHTLMDKANQLLT